MCVCVSCQVLSNSLWRHGLYSPPGSSLPGIFQARILGCHFLLQGIFLTQGLNLCLLHWQMNSLPLSYLGSLPIISSSSFLLSQTPTSQDWMFFKCYPFFLLPLLDSYFLPNFLQKFEFLWDFYSLALFPSFSNWLSSTSLTAIPPHVLKSRICGLQVSFRSRFWFLTVFKPQVLTSVFTLFSSYCFREQNWNWVENSFHYLHMCPSSVFPLSVDWGSFSYVKWALPLLLWIPSPSFFQHLSQPSDYVFSVAPNRIDYSLSFKTLLLECMILILWFSSLFLGCFFSSSFVSLSYPTDLYI